MCILSTGERLVSEGPDVYCSILTVSFSSSRFLLKREAVRIAFLLRKGCATWLYGKHSRNTEVFSAVGKRVEYRNMWSLLQSSSSPFCSSSQACMCKATHILSCSFSSSFTLTHYSDLSVYLFLSLRYRKVHNELLILNFKVT